MAQDACLACMHASIRAHHVICRECYDQHSNIISQVKSSPLDATEIRQKLWGQRYPQNRTPKHRVRIAYAAYVLAIQGDEEVLQEVRVDLRAKLPHPGLVHAADDGSEPLGPHRVGHVSAAIREPLNAEAQEVAFLEAKLREGRATARLGPGGFRTMDGHYVRSKSERDIANFLFQQRIPYQYERPTWIGGIALHPDFFLPDVSDSGLFLEHFGLMENADYRALAVRKAQLFEQAGRLWIATDEKDAQDIDAALRLKLGRYLPDLL